MRPAVGVVAATRSVCHSPPEDPAQARHHTAERDSGLLERDALVDGPLARKDSADTTLRVISQRNRRRPHIRFQYVLRPTLERGEVVGSHRRQLVEEGIVLVQQMLWQTTEQDPTGVQLLESVCGALEFSRAPEQIPPSEVFGLDRSCPTLANPTVERIADIVEVCVAQL